MTRSTRSLISIVAVLGALGALAPIAAAHYASVNSPVGAGDEGSGYSSPNAILADSGDAVAPQGNGEFSTVSSITGSEPVTVSPRQLASSPSDDGFDWGDASIGAAIGVSLAALLGLALMANRRRHQPQVQPSV
jgi:hypothetical protein